MVQRLGGLEGLLGGTSPGFFVPRARGHQEREVLYLGALHRVGDQRCYLFGVESIRHLKFVVVPIKALGCHNGH